MQELLTGKKRLPGFSGEWVETTLLELALGKKDLFDDGDWIESEHITTEGVRLIQTGNIGIGCYAEKDEKKFIFESSFVALRCKEVREGDLLICRLADPAGRACVLPDIGEQKIVTSVDVTIFRPPSSIANRVFLANLFSTGQWFREVSDRSGGTTHKRISRGALGRLRVQIPKFPEQTAIADILADMDAELAELESQLTKTRAIKQGMMQKLLTGEIRLL
jgi:type I restriction enzyme S subunit